jgi:hypothetical protein
LLGSPPQALLKVARELAGELRRVPSAAIFETNIKPPLPLKPSLCYRHLAALAHLQNKVLALTVKLHITHYFSLSLLILIIAHLCCHYCINVQ